MSNICFHLDLFAFAIPQLVVCLVGIKFDFGLCEVGNIIGIKEVVIEFPRVTLRKQEWLGGISLVVNT